MDGIGGVRSIEFRIQLNSEVVICEIIKKESVESNKLYK